jgi:uncharacterized protein
MKLTSFLIFIGIVLTIYGSVNFYIFIRGWQVFSKIPVIRIIYIILFLLLCLSFPAGQVLERIRICTISNLFIWVGSFWLGFMSYFFFSILILDILRGLNGIFNFFPQFVTADLEKSKLVTGISVIALSVIIIAAGYINACIPKIKKMDFTIAKKAGEMSSLHIVAVSDIHLGTIISNSRLERLVNSMNSLEPDIILLAGDIVDSDLAPVIKNNLGETLKKLKSKYGIYAVTGNHEYIGGVEEAVNYLSALDITVLRDRVVKINNSFYIAGRDDRSIGQFTGGKRKELEKVIEGVDSNLPVILMDHQPFFLKKTAETSVDLQLSGHTHHGQLWPFNFITSMIYEVSAGNAKINNTYFYVSSGFGTWGPPIRTNSRPEILDITVYFNK